MKHPEVNYKVEGKSIMPRFHEVIREMISGKVPGLTADLDRTESTIYKYAEDPNGPSGSPIPGNLIVPLCRSTSDHSIIDYMADQLNLLVIEPPDISSTPDGIRNCANMIKEFSDALNAYSKAFEDNVITRAEWEKFRAEAMEAIAAIHKTIIGLEKQISKRR